ncbi:MULTISPECIES: hypothetical protein [unclassified Sulfitobacter]|uniref:hypothetical protein n=1 Tax=Sulfitobacter TaxID=60136 RepID=UPI0023E0E964|nr:MULTISPECIES: hypothetical protein [unclassified Sulfitobacter]MDF3383548.1 hypothetical protein [Sulfitobacter sp. Ks11]MDF3386966.1 hypothetical protein [Sulfitobacter sp. M85]MDF3390386.1 hypothetical protein [Sulfitobacter sp. Ks16]MDF3401023.1 hypothetical protein [Sulfitobacter sp. KE39]MDF3404444.1 hypothetical protein [Sulfitobacter sp. Ks35]
MKILATVAATIALSGAAFAQTTSQAAVLGASDDAVYSLQVQGANGVVYNCKPDPVTVDGNTARVCVPAAADGAGLFAAGAGLGGGAAAAGAALVLVAVAASGSSSSTTTTN